MGLIGRAGQYMTSVEVRVKETELNWVRTGSRSGGFVKTARNIKFS